MNEPVAEFSRLIFAARLPPNGIEETLEAKPDERAALARRFDLIDIKSLTAQLAVKPGAQSIAVSGRLRAEVTQRCVVTLEPIAARVDVEITTHFVPEEKHQEGAGDPFPAEIEDECETFSDGRIDLGELAAQHLAINLDPYPRKKGAALPKTEFGAKTGKPHPFAGLAEAVKTGKKTGKTEE